MPSPPTALAHLPSFHRFFFQELEQELVPACLKLYFNPDDHGARSHLKAARGLWMAETEALEAAIMGIVDATAFCVVANEEVRVQFPKKLKVIKMYDKDTRTKPFFHALH